MKVSSWSFCWLMAELYKFQTFFLSFLFFSVFSYLFSFFFFLFSFSFSFFIYLFFKGRFSSRNRPVTQPPSPILLTMVGQSKVEFQAFCHIWKIDNLYRIVEGCSGRVGKELLRTRISSMKNYHHQMPVIGNNRHIVERLLKI